MFTKKTASLAKKKKKKEKVSPNCIYAWPLQMKLSREPDEANSNDNNNKK